MDFLLLYLGKWVLFFNLTRFYICMMVNALMLNLLKSIFQREFEEWKLKGQVMCLKAI